MALPLIVIILFVIVILCYFIWLFKLPSIPPPFKPSNPSITLKEAKIKWKNSMKKCPKTNENYLVIG